MRAQCSGHPWQRREDHRVRGRRATACLLEDEAGWRSEWCGGKPARGQDGGGGGDAVTGGREWNGQRLGGSGGGGGWRVAPRLFGGLRAVRVALSLTHSLTRSSTLVPSLSVTHSLKPHLTRSLSPCARLSLSRSHSLVPPLLSAACTYRTPPRHRWWLARGGTHTHTDNNPAQAGLQYT